MTTFRVKHTNNYTCVNNHICKDKSLSWKAKGIWLYAFSRPDRWVFHLNDLINQSTDGRDSVRAGLNELENAGYLARDRQRNEEGKFVLMDWTFFEVPQEDFKKSLPQTENPTLDFPTLENRPLVSTDKKISTEKKINTKSSSSKASLGAPPLPSSPNDDACGADDDACGADKSIDLKDKAIKPRKDEPIDPADLGDVTVTTTRGDKISMTQSAIYRHFVRRPVPPEVLKEAIRRIKKQEGPINNILKYLEAMCESIVRDNERNSKKPNSLTKNSEKAQPVREKVVEIRPQSNFMEVAKRMGMEHVFKPKEKKC